MHRHAQSTFALTMIGAVTCAVIAPAAVADEPEVIYLNGTVRDFRKSHPDFNITNGTGHVANNIALTSPNNRPVFTGNVGTAGFAVGSQWKNMYNQNIAPHMFFNGASLQLGSPPNYNPNNVNIDSWNSADGTYDPNTAGPEPPIVVGGPMPEVVAPTGLPPATEFGKNSVNQDVNLGGPGSAFTISQSFQCRDFTTDRDITIHIEPETDVTIYVTGNLELGRDSFIIVPESSTVNLYVAQSFSIGQRAEINMTQPLNPNRMNIYMLGSQGMHFHRDGKVCANIVAPYAHVELDQGDAFYGTIIAAGLTMSQDASLHLDGALEICGTLLNDVVGSISSSSAGAISSNGEHFNEWFTDVVGTNVSIGHSIALVRNPSGIYEYLDPAFFPIDNELFGNEGDAHNFNFTFTFSANFEYRECENQFFEFSGADDVWVYIDGQLVMDLGGVMPLTPQVAEMDRLDLEHEETYELHFFFAQRNPNTSQMNIRTNLPLESQGSIMVTIPFD